jgi:CubicO group peptidase (beta-lactamase class C family)
MLFSPCQALAPVEDANIAASPAHCFPPAPMRDGWSISSPQDAGFVEAALCSSVQQITSGRDNVHSIVVMRHGALIVEAYRAGSDRSLYSLWARERTFAEADQHDMRSISKSIVSLVYGILLARGEVPALETHVASLYPANPELASAPRSAIRVRDLLDMSSGLEWNEPSPVRRSRQDDETPLLWTGSIYRCVFHRQVVAAPGERFVYSGGDTAILADIVSKATGKTLSEIVAKELFEPLGIKDWAWVRDLRGRPMAYAGLRLRPRDLMKIGRLVLQKGSWEGRQIVPASWIDQSMTRQVTADASYGYGYQWWTSDVDWRGEKLAVVEAIGNGGQRLFLVPELDLGVVMTAGDYGQPEILRTEDGWFRKILDAVRSPSYSRS